MALKSIKVIEFGGLAPASFCGVMLADHGAQVIRIDKPDDKGQQTGLGRGKRSIVVDLKKPEGRQVALDLCKSADVLIEPFRAGVMERLKLGPNDLEKVNPGLIYARLTGFGQTGTYSARAGHDINYLAVSGVMSQLGRHKEKPHWPINLMADFAGGALMCAFGIAMALFNRSISGRGQVVDAAMVEGCAYLGTWFWSTRDSFLWQNEKGNNVVDGGAPFYEVYETKDGKYMSVGALESQFYSAFLAGLGIDENDMPQYLTPATDENGVPQLPMSDWPKYKEVVASKFAEKTQAEWCEVFDDVDACVFPVVPMDEAPRHRHNIARRVFLSDSKGQPQAAPAPQLSRTPGTSTVASEPAMGEHTVQILEEYNYTNTDIKHLLSTGAVVQKKLDAKL